MTTTYREEVTFREYDLTQEKTTIWFISHTERINHIALVIELWIEENQQKCMTGLAAGILCGMG